MENDTSFEDFYNQKLKELGLYEEPYGKFTALKKSTKFLWFTFSKVMGIIFEKPKQKENGWAGKFKVSAGMSGPVWNLAHAVKKFTGVDSEIEENPLYPCK